MANPAQEARLTTQSRDGRRRVGPVAAQMLLNRFHPLRDAPGDLIHRAHHQVKHHIARNQDPHAHRKLVPLTSASRALMGTGTRPFTRRPSDVISLPLR